MMTADGDFSLELRAAKARGEICRVWNCLAAHPQHAILWRCEAGHRKVNWYCRPCAEQMAVISAGAIQICQEPAVGPMRCGRLSTTVGETPDLTGQGAMSYSMTRPSGTMNST